MPKTMFGDEAVASGRTMFGDAAVSGRTMFGDATGFDTPDEFDAETARLARSRRLMGQQYVQGFEPQTPEQQNALEFGAGAKHALDRAALGLKNLLPQGVQRAGDTAEDYFRNTFGMAPRQDLQQLYEQGQAYVKDAGWRAPAGEVAADVAMAAAPLSRLNNAIAARSAAGSYAPAIGDIIANAMYSGVTAPENKTEAALYGGAGAGAGRLLSKALGSSPTRVTARAQEYLDQGIPLTPGQAGGKLSQHLENLAGTYPIFGQSIKKAQERARKEWTRQVQTQALERYPNNDSPYMLMKAISKLDPLTEKGVTPAQLARISSRVVDPENYNALSRDVLSEARRAASVLGKESLDPRLPLIPTANVLAFLLHTPTAMTALIVPMLYGTSYGRKFLLGQTSWQQFLLEHPAEAAQIGRAITEAMREEQPVATE